MNCSPCKSKQKETAELVYCVAFAAPQEHMSSNLTFSSLSGPLSSMVKNIDYKDGITRQLLHNCAGTPCFSFILCKVGPSGILRQDCFLGIFAIDTNRQSCPRSCHHDRRRHQCRRHLRSHHCRVSHWCHAGHRCVLIVSHHDGHCRQCAGGLP